jgi:hypothetical protein
MLIAGLELDVFEDPRKKIRFRVEFTTTYLSDIDFTIDGPSWEAMTINMFNEVYSLADLFVMSIYLPR